MTKLDLNLKQKLNLTTNLITSIEIIALNSIELYSFLEKESEDNVFIDYDAFFEDKMFRDYIRQNNKRYEDYSLNNSENEDIEIQDSVKYEPTLKDVLFEQLGTLSLSELELSIGMAIIHNIDDDGYFRIDIKEISDVVNADDILILSVLKKIQSFEPLGVGARNLKECLLLQIDQTDELLFNIINYHLDDIYKNNFDKIAVSQNIELDTLKEYVKKIKALNPKPSRGYKTDNNYDTLYIYPDIFVDVVGDSLTVRLKDSVSNVHINEHYLNMLDSDIDNNTRIYLKQKLSRTMFLIESIEKRRRTIQKVADKIVEVQKEFFLNNSPLKPMGLKDISQLAQISESTVSRATKNKYIQTPKGIYELKYFFSSHISTSNEDVSKDSVCKHIKDIISKENPQKPLSDQKITDILNAMGIDIKRRTVSKYREELNIPITKSRKKY